MDKNQRKFTVFKSIKNVDLTDDPKLFVRYCEESIRDCVKVRKFISLKDILEILGYDYDITDLLSGYTDPKEVDIQITTLSKSNPVIDVIEINHLHNLF